MPSVTTRVPTVRLAALLLGAVVWFGAGGDALADLSGLPPPGPVRAGPPLSSDPSARSADPADPASGSALTEVPKLKVDGTLRAHGTVASDPALDATGYRSGQTNWVESRLRLGGTWAPLKLFSVRLQFDALDGIAAGQLTTLGTARGTDTLLYRLDEHFGIYDLMLRQAYLTANLPFGQIRFGQQAFGWGLGLLNNDGEGDPDFGDRRYGDLVERLLYSTQPLQWLQQAPTWLKELTFFAAFDVVFRDANASLLDGDRAYQGVIGLQAESAGFKAGALETIRRQTDRPDPAAPMLPRTTWDVWITDAFARVVLARWDGGRALHLEGEGAVIAGDTTRPYPGAMAAANAAVRSAGGVLRLRYENKVRGYDVKLETGVAAGDNAPGDGSDRTFSFNPDYKVGFILFDQLENRLSARAIDRLADPALEPQVPAGLRYLATQGAVTNAAYLNPVIRWRPVSSVDLRLGYLLAGSSAAFIDPYSTLKAGRNTTYGGQSPGSQFLGQELDASARYRLPLPNRFVMRVGLEGGMFFPGAAFQGLGGSQLANVYAGRLLVDLAF